MQGTVCKATQIPSKGCIIQTDLQSGESHTLASFSTGTVQDICDVGGTSYVVLKSIFLPPDLGAVSLLSLIDAHTGEVIKEISLPMHLTSICWSGKQLWGVVGIDHKIYTIDIHTGEYRYIECETLPDYICSDGEHVVVANGYHSKMIVIDAHTSAILSHITRRSSIHPGQIAVLGNYILTAVQNCMYVVSLTDGSTLHQVPLDRGILDIVTDSKYIWILQRHSIVKVDSSDYSIIESIPIEDITGSGAKRLHLIQGTPKHVWSLCPSGFIIQVIVKHNDAYHLYVCLDLSCSAFPFHSEVEVKSHSKALVVQAVKKDLEIYHLPYYQDHILTSSDVAQYLLTDEITIV